MNLSELEKVILAFLEERCSLLLVGDSGQGKTQYVKQVLEKQGFFGFFVYLGCMEAGDVIGIQQVKKVGEREVSYHLIPSWMNEVIEFAEKNPDKKAVIVFDEMNHAKPDVRSVLFQLLNENRFHETILPSNVACLAMQNPTTENYGDLVEETNDALKSRVVPFKFTPTSDDFFNYAKSQKWDSRVVNFFKENTDQLRPKTAEFSVQDLVVFNRRQVEKIAKLSKHFDNMNDSTVQMIFTNTYGLEIGTQAYKYFKTEQKTLKADDIINKWDKVGDMLRKQIKENMVTVDVLHFIIDDVLEKLKDETIIIENDDQALNIINFLEILNQDLQVKLVLGLQTMTIKNSQKTMLAFFKEKFPKSNEKFGIIVKKIASRNKEIRSLQEKKGL